MERHRRTLGLSFNAPRVIALFACASVATALGGCASSDCRRELIVRVAYTGNETGLFVVRHHGPGSRDYGFSIGPLGPDAGQLHEFADECWADAGTGHEPLGEVEAWIDVDEDDYERCKDSTDRASCGPEPGDPAATTTFILKPTGLTHVDLTFGDM